MDFIKSGFIGILDEGTICTYSIKSLRVNGRVRKKGQNKPTLRSRSRITCGQMRYKT